MPTSCIPKLCRHKSHEQGDVTLNDNKLDLGLWPSRAGRKPPPDVQARYDELIAGWLANGKRLPSESTPLTVNVRHPRLWPLGRPAFGELAPAGRAR
jgi:hypothetical protein